MIVYRKIRGSLAAYNVDLVLEKYYKGGAFVLGKISRRETIALIVLLSIAVVCLALAFSGLQYSTLDLGFKRYDDGTFEMTATGTSEVIIATCIGIGIIAWFVMKFRG